MPRLAVTGRNTLGFRRTDVPSIPAVCISLRITVRLETFTNFYQCTNSTTRDPNRRTRLASRNSVGGHSAIALSNRADNPMGSRPSLRNSRLHWTRPSNDRVVEKRSSPSSHPHRLDRSKFRSFRHVRPKNNALFPSDLPNARLSDGMDIHLVVARRSETMVESTTPPPTSNRMRAVCRARS